MNSYTETKMTPLEKLNKHSVEACEAKILVCEELIAEAKEIENNYKKYRIIDNIVGLSDVISSLHNFQKSLENQIKTNRSEIQTRR